MTSDQGRQWRYPGARWWKFDFHTHTPASQDYGKGGDQASVRHITPKDWLLGFMRTEIDCVAVTDRNSGEWIDPLKQALSELEQEPHPDFRSLYLFPGVEVTANGGIHILAVLDTDKSSDDVTRLLGAVGYHGSRGASDITADAAPISVVEAISKAGGIPILAHVDGPSGAWKLEGNTLTPLLDFAGLFAMEVSDPHAGEPELYRRRKLSWTKVLGSDSHHSASQTGGHFPGSHYTWVKMATPSLEGLRLALLDGGGFSIRRSDESAPFDPFALPKYYIEAIEVEDARYMGRGEPVRLEFSPWLNALVGGRGTGKSTVIHALRLAARREHELQLLEERSGPRLTFERFNRVPSKRMDEGGLTGSTKLGWTVMRDGVRYRVRRKGDDTSVEEEAGRNWQPSSAQTVTPARFPIRMFNQGQIAELAGENQQALLQVIDEAAGVAALQKDLNGAKDAFYALRARIRELEGKLADRDALIVEHEDVERKLKRFEEAGHTAILTSYRRRGRQRRETERQFEVAAQAAGRLEEVAAELQPEDLPDELFVTDSAEDHEVTAIIDTLAAAVRMAADDVHTTAQRLHGVVRTQREALTKSVWQEAVNQADTNYDRLIGMLHEEGVADPSEYSRLVQDRQRIDGELARLDSLREERDRLVGESQAGLRRVLEARRAVSDARDRFLTEALADNKFVRIQSRTYSDDLRVLERSFREVLNVLDDRFQDDILAMEDDQPSRGSVAQLLADLPEDSAERRGVLEARLKSLKDRIEATCGGTGSFGGHFNNYLKRQFDRTPELLDKVLAWFPEDGLSVEYSRRGDGTDFRPIAQASAGQRAAAMLAFLLAHGEEPLVLDQPEDDLDNHLIYDLVVRQIRENKLRRQIIVVTHNPNVVVNGDAEMLHVLDFRAGQCTVVRSGSLQEEAIREEVCRVMEGGREAFERRYRRLGPEPVHV